MASNQLNFSLNVTANTSQAKQEFANLQNSLQNLITQGSRTDIGINFTKGMKEATAAAQQLQVHLAKAYNQKTGQLELDKLSLSLKSANQSVASLSAQMLQGGQLGQTAFKQIATQITNAQQPVMRLSGLVKELGTTFMTALKYQISYGAINAVTNSIREAVQYSKELNTVMTDIRIVTDKSAEAADKLSKRANQMAKELKASTTEILKAQLIYYQQGDSDAIAAKKGAITTKAAKTANVELQQMSEYLTAVWNSYQVGSNELELFVDKLAAVGAATATSMEEMATALSKVGATAKAVGVEYDQLNATIATISSVTRQSAESVGTALKTIYARLGDLKIGKTDEDGLGLGEVSSKLKVMGVDILDVNNELKDMGDIVEEVGDKWDGWSRAQKTAVAQAIAGKRQYTQLLALFENLDDYQSTLKISELAEGELDKQAKIWSESWEAASNKVKAATEGVYQGLLNDDVFIKTADVFAEIIERAGNLAQILGGIPGIIAMVTGHLMKVKSIAIAESVQNMAHSFSLMFNKGKAISEFESIKQQMINIRNTELFTQQTAEMQDFITRMSQINELQLLYNKNSKNMSSADKVLFQSSIQGLEGLNQQYEEALQYQKQLEASLQRQARSNGFKGFDINELKTILQRDNLITDTLNMGAKASGNDAFVATVRGLSNTTKQFSASAKADFQKIAQDTNILNQVFANTKTILGESSNSFQILKTAMESTATSEEKQQQIVEALGIVFTELNMLFDNTDNYINGLAVAFGLTGNEIVEFRNECFALQEAMKNTGASAEEIEQAFAKVAKRMVENRNASKNWVTTLGTITQVAGSLAQVSYGLDNLIDGFDTLSESASDGMSQIAMGVSSLLMVFSQIAQVAKTNPYIAIAAGILAVVMALVKIGEVAGWGKNKTQELNEELEKTRDKIKELEQTTEEYKNEIAELENKQKNANAAESKSLERQIEQKKVLLKLTEDQKSIEEKVEKQLLEQKTEDFLKNTQNNSPFSNPNLITTVSGDYVTLRGPDGQFYSQGDYAALSSDEKHQLQSDIQQNREFFTGNDDTVQLRTMEKLRSGPYGARVNTLYAPYVEAIQEVIDNEEQLNEKIENNTATSEDYTKQKELLINKEQEHIGVLKVLATAIGDASESQMKSVRESIANTLADIYSGADGKFNNSEMKDILNDLFTIEPSAFKDFDDFTEKYEYLLELIPELKTVAKDWWNENEIGAKAAIMQFETLIQLEEKAIKNAQAFKGALDNLDETGGWLSHAEIDEFINSLGLGTEVAKTFRDALYLAQGDAETMKEIVMQAEAAAATNLINNPDFLEHLSGDLEKDLKYIETTLVSRNVVNAEEVSKAIWNSATINKIVNGNIEKSREEIIDELQESGVEINDAVKNYIAIQKFIAAVTSADSVEGKKNIVKQFNGISEQAKSEMLKLVEEDDIELALETDENGNLVLGWRNKKAGTSGTVETTVDFEINANVSVKVNSLDIRELAEIEKQKKQAEIDRDDIIKKAQDDRDKELKKLEEIDKPKKEKDAGIKKERAELDATIDWGRNEIDIIKKYGDKGTETDKKFEKDKEDLKEKHKEEIEEMNEEFAEEYAKRSAEVAEQLAEKEEQFAESMAEAWKKEHLEQLKDNLEKQKDILNAFKEENDIFEFGLELLSEDDFSGKSSILTSQLENLTTYGQEMREEFERITAIIPETGEEAQVLADRITELGEGMRDNISKIRETTVAIQKLRIDAYANIAKTSIKELTAELDNLDLRIKILTSDNKNDYKYTSKLLNIQSLLPNYASFEDARANKAKIDANLVKQEQQTQAKINKIVSDAIAKQAKDNAAAREKERQNLIKDMQKARADAQKTLNDMVADHQKSLAKKEEDFDKSMKKLHTDYNDEWDKILIDEQKDLDEAKLKFDRKMEDIKLDYKQDLEDIEQDTTDKAEEIRTKCKETEDKAKIDYDNLMDELEKKSTITIGNIKTIIEGTDIAIDIDSTKVDAANLKLDTLLGKIQQVNSTSINPNLLYDADGKVSMYAKTLLPSEENLGSGTFNPSATPIKSSITDDNDERAYQIFTGLLSKGLDPKAAAAILGNLYQETTTFDIGQSANGAFGIAQWRYDRKDKLKAKYGENPTLQQQIDFIYSEISDPSASDKGYEHTMSSWILDKNEIQTKSIDEITTKFSKTYERAGDSEANNARRIKAANQYYKDYVLNNQVKEPEGSTTGEKFLAAGQSFLGTPYKDGGEDKNGIDCSGLVHQALIKIGYHDTTDRTAADYWSALGTQISQDEARAGDLVFFWNSEKGKVGHVGIYEGNGKVTHAGSKGVTSGASIYDMGKNLSIHGFKRLATGTPFHPGGLAMVGDENWLKGWDTPAPELAFYPDGSTELLGKDGMEIRDLPRGTEVLPADKTKQVLKGIPNYANGTYSFTDEEIALIQSILGNNDGDINYYNNRIAEKQTISEMKARADSGASIEVDWFAFLENAYGEGAVNAAQNRFDEIFGNSPYFENLRELYWIATNNTQKSMADDSDYYAFIKSEFNRVFGNLSAQNEYRGYIAHALNEISSYSQYNTSEEILKMIKDPNYGPYGGFGLHGYFKELLRLMAEINPLIEEVSTNVLNISPDELRDPNDREQVSALLVVGNVADVSLKDLARGSWATGELYNIKEVGIKGLPEDVLSKFYDEKTGMFKWQLYALDSRMSAMGNEIKNRWRDKEGNVTFGGWEMYYVPKKGAPLADYTQNWMHEDIALTKDQFSEIFGINPNSSEAGAIMKYSSARPILNYEGPYGQEGDHLWQLSDGTVLKVTPTGGFYYGEPFSASYKISHNDTSFVKSLTDAEIKDLVGEVLWENIIADYPRLNSYQESYKDTLPKEEPEQNQNPTTTATVEKKPVSKWTKAYGIIQSESALLNRQISESDMTDEEKLIAYYRGADKTVEHLGQVATLHYNEVYSQYMDYIEMIKDNPDLYDPEIVQGWVDQLNEIASTVQKAEEDQIQRKQAIIKVVQDEIQEEVNRLNTTKSLLQKHHNILNSIADAHHDINKLLAESESSYAYLDEVTREQLFNKEDYIALNEKLLEIEAEANELQTQYNEKIQTASADELQHITTEYTNQYDLLMKSYEVAKAELDITKKKSELLNVLNERNTRMFINGQWQWVANPTAVANAKTGLLDAQYNVDKLNRGIVQQKEIDAIEMSTADLTLRIAKLPEIFDDWIENVEASAIYMGKAFVGAGQMLSELSQGIWNNAKNQNYSDALQKLFPATHTATINGITTTAKPGSNIITNWSGASGYVPLDYDKTVFDENGLLTLVSFNGRMYSRVNGEWMDSEGNLVTSPYNKPLVINGDYYTGFLSEPVPLKQETVSTELTEKSIEELTDDIVESVADSTLTENITEPITTSIDNNTDELSNTLIDIGGGWLVEPGTVVRTQVNGEIISERIAGVDNFATGTDNAHGGISIVNEKGLELWATKYGQMVELNPGDKIFNHEQFSFLYKFSKNPMELIRGVNNNSVIDNSIRIGNFEIKGDSQDGEALRSILMRITSNH